MKKGNMSKFALIGLSIVAALVVIATLYGEFTTTARWKTLPAYEAMPQPNESGYASVNGIEMYFATYGKGEPILMIHGGLGHADVWGLQVKEFMKTNLVIVADSRGHGRTTRTSDPIGYDMMASDYVALLDKLKIDKVDIVGWSDGGIIGIAFALNHPERVKRVFADAANVTTDGVNPKVMENANFKAYIDRSREDYKRLSKTPTEFDAFFAQIGKMWGSQPNWDAARLAKIKTPITVVYGEYDEAILREHTDKMAKEIPGANLVILKDVSHFSAIQDAAGYNAAIRAFLDAK